ncbi:thiamine ABC transporter ATP-binding protein [Pseudoroseicyclus tamaricis]|uniref:ATP-binding cassette domain-containing protein n=1 Tax=Pseudoroseicyclus tamaricis TaxID=2705421 RepID=A0A6B2JME6_9RHOB|nr:ATP-binding cassette domain-containing protein [Pseudoroseicyclus tamaricis]NDV02761.1 ATP-binding cassette domain-containing protein [Pseudoroseicyclus tamaricis]
MPTDGLTLDALTLTQGDFSLSADLTVPEGQTIAVMGPSGGGKSTLLSGIAGFLSPTSGRILWNGQDITPAAPAQRPVTMLFQEHNLFPHLTLAQNVGLALGPSLKHAASPKVADALSRVGLETLGPRRPAEVSGGQRSRAALARILLAGKPLVLMDEPFAALGPGLKQDMLALVDETLRAAGRTLLMVTHDPADARAIADQVIVVEESRALPPTPTAELLDNPPPGLASYLGTSARARSSS